MHVFAHTYYVFHTHTITTYGAIFIFDVSKGKTFKSRLQSLVDFHIRVSILSHKLGYIQISIYLRFIHSKITIWDYPLIYLVIPGQKNYSLQPQIQKISISQTSIKTIFTSNEMTSRRLMSFMSCMRIKQLFQFPFCSFCLPIRVFPFPF